MIFGTQFYKHHLAAVIIKEATIGCERKPDFKDGLG